MQRGYMDLTGALRNSQELFRRVPQDRFVRLRNQGVSMDDMAIVFGVPRTWIEQAAAAYLNYADCWKVSEEEDRASRESLALAPMVAAAAEVYRRSHLESLRNESENATQGRVHRQYLGDEMRTYRVVDSRGRLVRW